LRQFGAGKKARRKKPAPLRRALPSFGSTAKSGGSSSTSLCSGFKQCSPEYPRFAGLTSAAQKGVAEMVAP
jgi:hypothetical protein